ncbi:hypothetical protein WA026_018480 [Henosepilachna vigintioctopunctata]|uniref:Protein kinase domain-containing protein n=1 Tax=Henosepilachna vigintioctopunctata TaxID=420089 RepID=A0AAW1V0E9_9CUCU
MHTPEGTLERGQSPPLYFGSAYNHFKGSVVSLPHLDLVAIPNKDECNNVTSSMLRIQSQLEQFTIHKSSSEPAVAIDIPTKGLQNVSPFGTPDTPPPPYDIKQGWMTGIFGCLRPVLSIIGKGGHEIRNEQDDWEISFEQITDLTYLGCGGQGAVFSGKINNEPVAVKKVSDIKETDIKNLRKLNHPNIVKFKGVCTQAPCYSIIMEFCPYGPLFNLLKNQKNVVTTNRVVTWAKQIAGGMTYLHAHKIIHRDLKSPKMPRQRIGATTRGTTDMEVYRKAAKEHLEDGEKIRALLKNLIHFKKQVKPSIDQKCLLLLDPADTDTLLTSVISDQRSESPVPVPSRLQRAILSQLLTPISPKDIRPLPQAGPTSLLNKGSKNVSFQIQRRGILRYAGVVEERDKD